ncbi:MAG: rhomboid family intramembrane serine protease [Planctomycetes bacterium]|nr:rhomboid family intramembrane serine protease [Planctomycetota bacterium]
MFIVLPVGDVNSRRTFPFVNYLLAAVNCYVFFAYGLDEDFIYQYALIPERLEPLTFLTSMFLHGSLAHLIGNMLFLLICGDNVEDKVGHFGYLVLYLVSGLIASGAHVVTHYASDIPTIGASGAVAGILGSYLAFFPFSRIKFWAIFLIFPFSFYMPAIVFLGFWFVQQLLLSYAEISYNMPSGMAYWAHAGGFAFGLFVSIILRMLGVGSTERKRERK